MTADQVGGYVVAFVVIMLMVGAFVLMKPGEQKPPRQLPASQNPIPQPEPDQWARKNIMSKQPVVLAFDGKNIDMSSFNTSIGLEVVASAAAITDALGGSYQVFELWRDWYEKIMGSVDASYSRNELLYIWNNLTLPAQPKAGFAALAEDMNDAVYKPAKGQYGSSPASAISILSQARDIQEQRARDYDQPGGERSMLATVQAFNIITRRNDKHALTESEGWLVLQILKDVRDRSTDKPHFDSLLDGVSYSSLKAEARLKEVVAEPTVCKQCSPDSHCNGACHGVWPDGSKIADEEVPARVPKITPYKTYDDEIMTRPVVYELLHLVKKHCKDTVKVKRIMKEGAAVERLSEIKDEDLRCVGILARTWLEGWELAQKNGAGL